MSEKSLPLVSEPEPLIILKSALCGHSPHSRVLVEDLTFHSATARTLTLTYAPCESYRSALFVLESRYMNRHRDLQTDERQTLYTRPEGEQGLSQHFCSVLQAVIKYTQLNLHQLLLQFRHQAKDFERSLTASFLVLAKRSLCFTSNHH